MRWKTLVGGLALLAAVTAGCKQQCFIGECDYDHYRALTLGAPSNLDCNPSSIIATAGRDTRAPATVLDPDRPIRYLSLAEAISVALEQGTVGSQSVVAPGVGLDNLVSFQGRGVGPSDAVRVLALDPAIVGAGIEASLSKFDAVFTTSMTWSNTDRPIGSPLDVFQTGGQQLNAIESNQAQFQTGIVKPLPTGGVAGITFRTDYEFTNLPARVNPSYRPALQFQFEQPLLQGFGVEINQLRNQHPGSLLTPGVFNPQPTAEGILVTRLRFDQQRAEFERNVTFLLLNVETAYWNLYGSYWTLYSREAALRQAYESWKFSKAQFDAGRKPIAELAQVLGQYELFRGQRLTALGQVLENERQLRALLGMPVEDGNRLVPSDSPNLSPYRPDWTVALNEALSLRPELVLARQDLKSAQFDVILQKNQLLPDLRLTATYDYNGLGNRLDGANANNALRSLADGQFSNSQVGLRLNVPLGFRLAHANLRISRLTLARSYNVLQDQELKTERFLGLQFRRVFEFYELIRAQRAQREAFGTQLEARFQEFLAGRSTADILLEAQRFWADALANEYNAIVQYNNTLAAFEFAKGTLLKHDNVVIAEGALPGCAQVRAVEHHRQRTLALVACERSLPHDGCCGPDGDGLKLPSLPGDAAPTLPALLKDAPKLPPEALQPPAPGVMPAPAPGPYKTDLGPTPKTSPILPASGGKLGTGPFRRDVPSPFQGDKSPLLLQPPPLSGDASPGRPRP